MATPPNTSSLLLFRVGPVLCCAPSLSVISIILPPTLTHPPGTNAAKPGIFRHGGHIVSSLDLRYQFGVAQDQWVRPGRMIVTQLSKGRVGFWIDEIREVIEPPAAGWGPLPPLLPRGVFARTLLLNEEIYLHAEFDALYNIPNHGYLRGYIQHLLATQARHSATSAGKPSTQSRTPRMTTTANQERADTDPSPQIVPAQTNAQPAAAIPTSVHHQQKPPASKTGLGKQTSKSEPLPAKTKPAIPADRKPAAPSHTVKNSTPTTLSSIHRKDTTATRKTDMLAGLSKPRTTVTKTATQNNHKAQTDTSRFVSPRTTLAPASAPKKAARPVTAARNNTASWLFAIFLLILLGGTTWSVWTNSQPEFTSIDADNNSTASKAAASFAETTATESSARLNITPKKVTTASQPESAITDVITSNTTKQRMPIPEANTATATDATAPLQSSPITDELADSTANNDGAQSLSDEHVSTDVASPLVSESEPLPVEADIPVYRASIEQDSQGLTIMIDAPDDADIFKNGETPVVVSALSTTMSSTLPQAVPTAPAPTTRRRPEIKNEVIHIVVKGDTLWHIAIRYLNNPFLYPELARLSNIKNPDLIYPGNRVRIVKRRKKSDN